VLKLYGIPNCDACRKARKLLDANSVNYRFHDFRADGLERTLLGRWTESVGWQKLLNTRSTTWRELPESARKDLNETRALELILQHPTLIKRPVLEKGNDIFVGFSEAEFAALITD
jgi:Spx/MgsR family transcriptional regulator